MNHHSPDEHEPYTGYTGTPDDHLVEGFDPEVALDLGIAVDDESLHAQRESGQAVARALSKSALRADGASEHAQVEAAEGRVTCANCNKPGCPGCGRS